MARPQAFERELKVATAGLEPAAIAALLAKTARQALVEAQGEGVFPTQFVRTVNGRVGVPEENVQPPGPIVYIANWLSAVAIYALTYAQGRSPVLSGRFQKSWIVLRNGALVTDFDTIEPGDEIIIVNTEPYSRRLEIGKTEAGRAFVVRVPPGIVEDTRQAVLRRFGNIITAERRFINLASAYALRSSQKSGRKGRVAGSEVTYPALIINQQF